MNTIVNSSINDVHNIALEAFKAEGGVQLDIKDNALQMSTTRTIKPDCRLGKIPVNSYIYLPELYHLPLRIDMTVKIDSPELILLIGNGHIDFGSEWSNNLRIDDILEPNLKTRFFDNRIPINESVDITVILKVNAMQIMVNGEDRYYSKKEPYMKSELLNNVITLNEDTTSNSEENGLSIKLSCTKSTKLVLKSMIITENYEAEPLPQTNELPRAITRSEAVGIDEKPTFASCISLLPDELKNEVIKTDEFIIKLKPLKLKRKVESNKITYVASDYGFSYTMFISNDLMHHSLNWYVIHNNKYKHQEKDYMLNVLDQIDQKAPEFAQKMFRQIRECAGEGCMDTKLYKFKGNVKKTCNGRIEFKMRMEDFEDVRTFIEAVNELAITQ